MRHALVGGAIASIAAVACAAVLDYDYAGPVVVGDASPAGDAEAGTSEDLEAGDACASSEAGAARPLAACDPSADPTVDCDGGGIACGTSACTDPSSDQLNCGYCGHQCNPCTGVCPATRIATSPDADGARLVGIGHGYVYWTEQRNAASAIARQHIDAAATADGGELFRAYPKPPNDVHVDGGRVIVATDDGLEILDGCGVVRVPSNGNAVLSAWSDAAGLYWSDSGGNIWRSARDGSSASILTSGQGTATHVFAAGGFVYYLQNVIVFQTGAALRRVRAGGGDSALVAGDLPSVLSLAPGASSAFAHFAGPGPEYSLGAVGYDGSRTTLAKENSYPQRVVAAGAFVFFVGQPVGTGWYSIWRESACGGPPRRVRPEPQPYAVSLVVDDENVYWNQMGDGGSDIYRTRR